MNKYAVHNTHTSKQTLALMAHRKRKRKQKALIKIVVLHVELFVVCACARVIQNF